MCKYFKFINISHLKARNPGFTLAEILLALVIIGVVASITIPALIQNTQNAQLKTAWKKDYSIIAQAQLMAMNDNAGDINSYLNSIRTLAPLLNNYLNSTKLCAGGVGLSPCFTQHVTELDGTTVGTTGLNKGLFDDGGISLANGSTLAFENNGDTYNGIYYAYIWVDVNGNAPPNTIGEDIFGIIVLRNQIIPMGIPASGIPINHFNSLPAESTCVPGTTSGIACSAIYLTQ